MMETLVGGGRHRTVYWLGPPTLGDQHAQQGRLPARSRHALGSREVRARRRVRRHLPPVRRRERRLLAIASRRATASVRRCESPTACTSASTARSTSATVVWKLLDKRWHITAQADPVAADRIHDREGQQRLRARRRPLPLDRPVDSSYTTARRRRTTTTSSRRRSTTTTSRSHDDDEPDHARRRPVAVTADDRSRRQPPTTTTLTAAHDAVESHCAGRTGSGTARSVTCSDA